MSKNIVIRERFDPKSYQTETDFKYNVEEQQSKIPVSMGARSPLKQPDYTPAPDFYSPQPPKFYNSGIALKSRIEIKEHRDMLPPDRYDPNYSQVHKRAALSSLAGRVHLP